MNERKGTMKIILSPAKKMNVNTDSLETDGIPVFLKETNEILSWLRSKSREELQALWKCNDSIAKQNFKRVEEMKLKGLQTPAILSYEGIAFQYMAPIVFETGHFQYVQEHLRILSAFYGVLKPMDAVTPYRLEMQAKTSIEGYKDLYAFWGDKLYKEIRDESGIIINLASREYSKCIEKYLKPEDSFITISFVERANGRLVTKGTYAKMARGDMVRYMAENRIEEPEGIKNYNRLGYMYRDDLSHEKEFVFERT